MHLGKAWAFIWIFAMSKTCKLIFVRFTSVCEVWLGNPPAGTVCEVYSLLLGLETRIWAMHGQTYILIFANEQDMQINILIVKLIVCEV